MVPPMDTLTDLTRVTLDPADAESLRVTHRSIAAQRKALRLAQMRARVQLADMAAQYGFDDDASWSLDDHQPVLTRIQPDTPE